ncbi:MAG: hypothetical protein Q4G69_06390 [Planctomycetia bacterium]|nr:hypothetical protein [Planctomycetia bacterium]
MADRSEYQDKIIKRYYKNLDAIMEQKLSELVTELYLSEGKKRAQLWKRAAAALKNLGVPEAQIQHLVDQDNPELLLRFIQQK